MAEVRVIARSVAREGKEDQLRGLLQDMLTPTRVEPGCKLYELYVSDSRERYFYEGWESQAALDQHVATPHFKHLEQSVGDLVTEPLEVSILKGIVPDNIPA
jgi:quinol monooxygenase YgiN